jgi:regulatory protein
VVEFAGRFLEARSRSVGEVRRRLTTAGFRASLVEEAITRLIEVGFLDDEAFASAWVESRDRARPRGEHALRRELALKGIDRGVVDQVLAARRGEADADDGDSAATGDEVIDPDRAAAERLLERRRAALEREPDLRKRRQKAYALLARNGFAPDIASEVSRRIADEPGAGLGRARSRPGTGQGSERMP